MDKLLQWSIAQQSGDKEAIKKIGQPDAKALGQLFGGPDEPALMKQAMTIINSPEATLEDKEVAFENFEMLIENIDNANNVEQMKLWPDVIQQLLDEVPTSLRVTAASCVGVAVQNNPSAQEAFLKYNGVEKLVEIASKPETPTELHLKALFAISCLITNFKEGYRVFDKENGWQVIDLQKEHPEKVKMRILAVLSAILSTTFNEDIENHIHKNEVVTSLCSIMRHDGHIGCIDKALNVLTHLANLGFSFTSTELADVIQGLERIKEIRNTVTTEEYDMLTKRFK